MPSDLPPEVLAALPGLLDAATVCPDTLTVPQMVARDNALDRLEALAPTLARAVLAAVPRLALADRLAEAVEREHADWRIGGDLIAALAAYREAVETERETLRAAMERIVRWADAYPIDIFPEVEAEWRCEAAAALKSVGLTIDRLSASDVRYAIKGARDIAIAALAAYREAGEGRG